MSSKIEVSRVLLERVTLGDASRGANAVQLVDAWVAMGELRSILAVPVVSLTDEGNRRAAPLVERQPVAWMTGKLIWPLKSDAVWHSEKYGQPVVPLYAEQPAPVSVVLPRGPEKAFLEWASSLGAPPTQMQAFIAGIDKVKELNGAKP